MTKGWSVFWMLVLLVPSAAWASYVITCLWAWFAEPIGAPHIGVVRTMGLCGIVGLLRYSGPSQSGKTEEKTGGELFFSFLGRAFLVPLVALGIGYLYSKFL